MEGRRIAEVCPLVKRRFVISRIRRGGNRHEEELAGSDTVLRLHDWIPLVTSVADSEAVAAFFGREVRAQWDVPNNGLTVRRILMTRSELQGRSLKDLEIRKNLAVSITRINRSGIDLVASPNLYLQMGNRVTVVGSAHAVSEAEKALGNSARRLNAPNLFHVFAGIAVGCLLGCLPFEIPGIPHAIKLGLAGGPLIVAILMGRFGPSLGVVTYTTTSANLLLREIGIALFLACVGMEAGKTFVATVIEGNGLLWMGCGAIITVLPLLVAGLVGRIVLKLNYYTLIGVLSGANTNPPALAFANVQAYCDAPTVGYATVYPLAMFLRMLTAQLFVLLI